MTAYLILENGTVFEGQSFGAEVETVGELAFTTGMGGYLETLTDPSYYGQIILQTFPLIGNYGVIPDDFESNEIFAKAYIAKHLCKNPSNFRCEGDLDAFLKKRGIPGVCGIDTRALTKMIREIGVMNGKITFSPPTQADIDEAGSYKVENAVAAVSGSYLYDSRHCEDCVCKAGTDEATRSSVYTTSGLQSPKHKIALMDFGVKKSIPEAFAARGCAVQVFPHDASAEDIIKTNPDGIMLSNGPGDPAAPGNAGIINTVRTLMDSTIPMFGICIGHQFMALAAGYKTRKMKFGHRGSNQPVKDMRTGRVYITAQNHGYTVVAGGSAFINVNDGSCEGLDYGTSFSVQFHPEARSGPFDTGFLFDRFLKRIKER